MKIPPNPPLEKGGKREERGIEGDQMRKDSLVFPLL